MWLEKIKKLIKTSKDGVYVSMLTLFFFLIIWLINPSNKLIFLSFFILGWGYYRKIKNIEISMFLTYVASLIVDTGKTYNINLVPPGFYNEQIWPFGYNVQFIINTRMVISSGFGLIILYKVIKNTKILKFILKNKLFITLSLYVIWIICSDIVGSIKPSLSLLFSSPLLIVLITYCFGWVSYKKNKKLLSLVIAVLSSLVIVESVISFSQLLAKSPLGKTIERQVGIEYWGGSPDEIEFTFRPVGTFLHANILGYWLSFALLFLMPYYLKEKKKFLGISILLGFLSLITTLSRSAWLGLVVGLIYMIYSLRSINWGSLVASLRKNKKLKILIPVLGVFIVFFILPRVYRSTETLLVGGGYFRYLQIKSALRMIKSHPIFGVGTGMNVLAALSTLQESIFLDVPLSVHNWYFLVIVENGITVLFFLVLVVKSFLYNQKNITKRTPDDLNKYILTGYKAGLISLLVVAFFQPFMDINLIVLGLIFL